jgi:Arc/MetJ family transcription regulator
MTRLSITVDETLVERARELAAVRTKREVIELALQEFVQRRRLERLMDLVGSDVIDMTPEELREWRDLAMPDE